MSGPKSISQGFDGLSKIKHIDGAFVWPYNNMLYVFKGRRYWRFNALDQSGKYVMSQKYPRRISSGWKGFPDHLSGLFTWRNGETFVFKGKTVF